MMLTDRYKSMGIFDSMVDVDDEKLDDCLRLGLDTNDSCSSAVVVVVVVDGDVLDVDCYYLLS